MRLRRMTRRPARGPESPAVRRSRGRGQASRVGARYRQDHALSVATEGGSGLRPVRRRPPRPVRRLRRGSRRVPTRSPDAVAGDERPTATARWSRVPRGAVPARVTRVVDGDTVELSGLGSSRLIGVDTPEVHGGVECYGREASAFTKKTLAGSPSVRYELGVERRDRYGRPLVYVWLDDGRFLNGLLVSRGYAAPLTIAPSGARRPLRAPEPAGAIGAARAVVGASVRGPAGWAGRLGRRRGRFEVERPGRDGGPGRRRSRLR